MRHMPTASQTSLNPNDLTGAPGGYMKKRFDAQNVHLIHHNAVLPDREQLRHMESPDPRGKMKSPYIDPYENIPAKPNRVQTRDLTQQLR